ncbi:alpha/beta fold hydrolase [Taibaiella koreensis]|uniref:alpha/beta fold hydrolase n=1 Tax=Taibaiella koreensis TaxID=1268548 RepID=UPI000E59F52F|nr:alpha/beta hydrolase [Taibaiella koreensis]
MEQIISKGLPISYNRYGDGPVTLLFVHGAFIDQTYWVQQVACFAPRYTVVTMDLAGHGASGREREQWDIRDMADDVVNLIKALKLQQVILIGHSLGADIILLAATSYPDPVTGFIVIDNFKNVATPLPPEYESQVEGIIAQSKQDFAGTNERYARMVLVTPATPQWITDKIVAAYRNAYEPMGQQTLPQFFTMDKIERERVPRLAPVLHLVNVNYMPTNREPLEQHAVNGYNLVEIEGTSHYPMLEHPDALNHALEQIIEEIKTQ